ncbi:hypothetical protein QAD02_005548 [Eretmocerus hayati]|uniref:Uncharacterized protein n=1 Tax=Eretmocerus hayati TaxID=131215 RepID=A0ACC2NT14_9HYME|nr:hypothetical protein QAD02_005548 [Eretmocerus hayati]
MDYHRNGILDALKELLNILSCSKCNKSFCDTQQFLKCGHLSCLSCLNNSRTCYICSTECSDPQDNVLLDKIVQLCENVAVQADNLRLKQERDIGQFPSQHEAKPPVDHTKDVANHNHHTADNSTKPTQTKKRRKRKGRSKSNCEEENNKKPKIITFKIPKNIERKNHNGETILLVECRKNHIDNVKMLLAANPKPNLNTCCAAGWTPLQECADFGYIDMLSLLLKEGADPNFQGFEGRTALHEAAKSNYTEIMKLLLEYKADKDISDSHGKRPIDYCQSPLAEELLTCTKKDRQLANGQPHAINDVQMQGTYNSATENGSKPRIVSTGRLRLRDIRRKSSSSSKDSNEKGSTSSIEAPKQPKASPNSFHSDVPSSIVDPLAEQSHRGIAVPSTSRCDWGKFAIQKTRETFGETNSRANDTPYSNQCNELSINNNSLNTRSYDSNHCSQRSGDVNGSEESHHLDLYYAGSDTDTHRSSQEPESTPIESSTNGIEVVTLDDSEIIDVEN